MVKYRGWAFLGEYMNRSSNGSPITVSTDGKSKSVVYNGEGVNTQLSYQFINKWEIGSRYTIVRPSGDTRLTEPQQEDMSIGVTKYLNYHRLKLQWEAVRTNRMDLIKNESLVPNYTLRFQIEIGI